VRLQPRPVYLSTQNSRRRPSATPAEPGASIYTDITAQERISQQYDDQLAEIPAPMTQKEIVHVPKTTQQYRHHQFVEILVPMQQEEIVRVRHP